MTSDEWKIKARPEPPVPSFDDYYYCTNSSADMPEFVQRKREQRQRESEWCNTPDKFLTGKAKRAVSRRPR